MRNGQVFNKSTCKCTIRLIEGGYGQLRAQAVEPPATRKQWSRKIKNCGKCGAKWREEWSEMAGNHHPESRSAAAANTSATAAPPPIVLDLLHWCQCQPLETNINIRKARSIPRRGLATVVELKLKAHRHSDEIFSLLQFALRLPTPFVRAVAISTFNSCHPIRLNIIPLSLPAA